MGNNDWTDQPIGKIDDDRLDFDEYSQILTEIARTAGTPLTIGIFGPWGSGKTSLMQLTAEALEGKYKAPPAVWFNAWHYDKEEALWRALVVRVLAELRPDVPDSRKPTDEEATLTKKLDDLEASLYKVVQREELGGVTVDWGQAAKGVAMGTVHLGLSLMPGLAAFSKLLEKGQEKIAGDDITLLFDAVQREKQKIYREHVRSMEQFRKEFADIVKEQVIDQDRRLIVFIDDLDRCLPEKAIEVLEALKLFLDVPGCVFFLGVDRQIIQRGIQVKYKGFLVDGDDPEAAARRIPISGDDYLEKIVQLPFHLLPLDRNRIRQFIERGAYDLPEGCDDVFATGLEANPRKVKRALHIFLLLQKLAQLRRGEFKVGGETVPVVPPLLAKIVVIQSRYRNLYQDLTEAPAFLRYLERHMLGEIEPDETVDARFTRWLELYREYLPLRQMLQIGPRFGDLPEGGVDLYLYLTATTDEGRQDEDEKSRTERWWRDLLSRDGARIERAATALKQADAATADTIRQRLTAALERRDGLAYGWEEFVSMGQALARLGDGRDLSQMASVPLGEYPVGPEGQVESAPGFSIGKYLVANGQYQAFIDEHPDHLPPTDWDPETRQHPAGKSNYPVVYVSYEDAVAYAQWRNKRLPEQREWEAAAQGQAGRAYPFGDAPQREKANTAELDLGGATPVGAFPEDVSPMGLLDMTGNVSEWTQTGAGVVDGEQAYVVKGGNWQLAMSLAQNDADTFQRVRKTQKSAAIGFRLAE